MPGIVFDGHVAIVTGAGRGIGAAHARELSGRGARVVVNDLDRASADEVVAGITADGGIAVASYHSVATEAGGSAIVDDALDAFGSVEMVVNNPGLRRTGYFGSLTLEQIDDVLDSHLRAGFFVTQPAWEVMKRNSYGRVIFTGSAAGMFSCQGLSNYAAAKAGLYGLTKALAYEGREHGINVNCVLPWANTAVPGMAPRVKGYRDELRRFIDPDELARVPGWRTDTKLTAYLVAALVSPSCAITGEAISMCQGRFARVVVGLCEGWIAPEEGAVDADIVVDHLAEIRDQTVTESPMWMYEELAGVVARLSRDGV